MVLEVRVNLRPAAVILLEGVTVVGEAPMTPERRGFEHRRSLARGQGFTEDDFERLKAGNLLHVLTAEVPGVRYQNTPLRRSLSLNFRRCEPAVFVNGFESPLAFLDLLDGMPLHLVAAMEVYRTWSDTPVEFMPRYRPSSCGVIAIWTKWAFRR
jgi:hypothetical protein